MFIITSFFITPHTIVWVL